MILEPHEISKLEEKIAAAEQLTTAEFKIIICPHSWLGLRRKARKLFRKYRLHETAQRNGVLILIVEKDRELLIYGDRGITEKVGENYWLNVSEAMLERFREGEFAHGLALGLHMLSDALVEHFPRNDASAGELSNEIIFER